MNDSSASDEGALVIGHSNDSTHTFSKSISLNYLYNPESQKQFLTQKIQIQIFRLSKYERQ